MRPSLSLSLSIVRSSVRCVLVYPFTAVVFAALFSSLAHSLLASVRLLSTIFPLMMNSRRGNDWGELRVILFRSCRNFFLENSFFLFSIGLKFLGFNYPWKMLKLNSVGIEILGYFLETREIPNKFEIANVDMYICNRESCTFWIFSIYSILVYRFISGTDNKYLLSLGNNAKNYKLSRGSDVLNGHVRTLIKIIHRSLLFHDNRSRYDVEIHQRL